MRGEKIEGKMAGPLFPRLHVNDTDKGGPKPPPRNKMALYEQLSIPSQRFTDAPVSVLPLPPIYGGTVANTDSPNQGRGLEKSRFSPFQNSAASNHSNMRQGSFSTEGLLNESNGNSFKRLMPTTESNDVSHLKWPSRLKNETEFKARSLFRPAVSSDTSLNKDQYFGCSSSLRLPPDVTRLEISITADQESDGNLKAVNEGSLTLYEADRGHDKQENNKNAASVVKARDNISPAMSLMPTSSCSQQKSSVVNAGVLSIDPGLETRLSYSHSGCPNAVQNDLRCEDEDESGPLPTSVLNRNEDPTSNALALGGVSCTFISPDDVVEMIGYKHFWKVRRAIINQQRVFSMQVFELHRIIKVQRIIAGSRRLPTEDSVFLHKLSSLKEPTPNLVSEKIKLPSENPFQPENISSGILKNAQKLGKSAFLSSSLDNDLPIWNVPPPVGNQWLVPVMSPSEGLIYKPYKPPPCPPPVGYDPTLYGTYGYNLPVAPSIGPKYFDPYGGIPAMTPSIPMSTIDEVDTSIDANNGEKLETKAVIRTSRFCDVALPLFPTAPTGCGAVPPVGPTQGNEQKTTTTQVIKVVPHNPKLASESTARIIELIQEERKHLCN
ncbi:hypothetical protein RND81_11G116400 [Saponaria officinalis]|uniref:EARLY FLOWERING 3 n=1 Tax=Saponaria officinalis TaxID=3572 RepID=A0AAW1HKW1_SAPOF